MFSFADDATAFIALRLAPFSCWPEASKLTLSLVSPKLLPVVRLLVDGALDALVRGLYNGIDDDIFIHE